MINFPCAFNYHFMIPFKKDWTPSKRTFDLSNKIESINDLFVDQWLILDDDYTIISKISITWEYVEYLKWEVFINIFKIDG